MPFCVFSKMAAAAILDLLFVDFGPPTMSQLLGSMLPANIVMILEFIRDIMILPFHDFGWKMPIPANFGGFWEILTP